MAASNVPLPGRECAHIREERRFNMQIILPSRLFDYLIGSGQKPFWDAKAERLGGLEVDGERILVRRLHR
jgi:hypothetical protein